MLNYKTIKKQSEGFYKEKASKFLAFAYQVKSEGEIADKIKQLKKKYHDARHFVYAYKIGIHKIKQRANDDGEPSNSAGSPVLNRILKYELHNILIVVIRYFGGKLLGVGGLINAYGTAAENAILNSKIITKEVKINCELEFDFDKYNKIIPILHSFGCDILSDNYTDKCRIKIAISKKKQQNFEAEIRIIVNDKW